jgi:hypothetical protein
MRGKNMLKCAGFGILLAGPSIRLKMTSESICIFTDGLSLHSLDKFRRKEGLVELFLN